MLNRLAGQGVAVYGINYKDDGDAARRWLTELGNPYRFNVEDPQGSLGINLGVYGAPETFLIDKDGIIRHKFVGAIDERVWREQLAPLYRELLDEAGQ
jgi:cytochrome c biogenesis protein CcmG/thiol:disulfide interchange protein DsbE